MWIIIGLLLLVAGGIMGAAGFIIGAFIGALLGLFALVRVFLVGRGLERERGGAGQSGPGSPGYHGRVSIGEEGGTAEGPTRRAD